MKHYSDFFKKYFDFDGKANRTQYWTVVLINIVIGAILGVISYLFKPLAFIAGLFELAILIPSLSIVWRRLHDTGRSGLNFFWVLFPIVGWIILLVFLIDASK